jgi:hypothetical protein
MMGSGLQPDKLSMVMMYLAVNEEGVGHCSCSWFCGLNTHVTDAWVKF